MSGHSHWATIKHKKAAADAKRGKIFSKLLRVVTIAARGGSDPDANLALRHALDKAKEFSVPRESVERATKKGAGELEGQNLVEATYGGFGPGGVAMLIETVTDNTNRTQPEVRKIFESHGGKFASASSTAWMFARKGLFGIPKTIPTDAGGGAGDGAGGDDGDRAALDEERLLEIVIDAGADDVTDAGSNWELTCPPESFDAVRKALAAARIPTEVAELTYIADNELEIDPETQRKNLSLMDAVEDHDDVQNVYAAFTPSEEVVAEMGGD